MTSAERDNPMSQNDTPHPKALLAALRLLSRLPLPVPAAPPEPSAAWAWPVAGAVIGGLAALAGWLTSGAGPAVAAAVVLGTQAMLTGAMHEDGLADSADGLWGGWDRPRRLAIMKDSHIGTYGVMTLIVTCLIRWSALTALLAAGNWWAPVIVGVISRAPMVLMLALMPNARGAGLAQSVGRVPMRAAWLALVLALGPSLLPGASLALIPAVALVAVTLALVARSKIGGQTGDILGASQQLSEAAALGVLAASI